MILLKKKWFYNLIAPHTHTYIYNQYMFNKINLIEEGQIQDFYCELIYNSLSLSLLKKLAHWSREYTLFS